MIKREIWMSIGIFFLAFIVRIVVGYFFWESFDLHAFIKMVDSATQHNLMNYYTHYCLAWNYFPVIPFYLWISVALATKTAIPFALCIKILPIIFDSLLAALVYNIIRRFNPSLAGWAGVLYALSPVAIFVDCIHAQWDAGFLFFLILSFYIRDFYYNSYVKYFVFGCLFAFSILVKPLALILFPLFFSPRKNISQEMGAIWRYGLYIIGGVSTVIIGLFAWFKISRCSVPDLFIFIKSHNEILWAIIAGSLLAILFLIIFILRAYKLFNPDLKKYCNYQIASILGACVTVGISLVIFSWAGFDLLWLTDQIFRYLNQGGQVCGVHLAHPFVDSSLLVAFLKNRLWIVFAWVIFNYYYYKHPLDVYRNILLLFTFIFGVTGICPQYAIWIVPFALIAGYFRTVSLFNILAMCFLLLLYSNSVYANTTLISYLTSTTFNLGFVPLREYAYLWPLLWWRSITWCLFIEVLGNYLIPLWGIVTTVCIWINLKQDYEYKELALKKFYFFQSSFIWINILLLLVCFFIFLVSRQLNLADLFKQAWDNTSTVYNFSLLSNDNNIFRSGAIIDCVTLGLVVTFLWSAFAWHRGCRCEK